MAPCEALLGTAPEVATTAPTTQVSKWSLVKHYWGLPQKLLQLHPPLKYLDGPLWSTIEDCPRGCYNCTTTQISGWPLVKHYWGLPQKLIPCLNMCYTMLLMMRAWKCFGDDGQIKTCCVVDIQLWPPALLSWILMRACVWVMDCTKSLVCSKYK